MVIELFVSNPSRKVLLSLKPDSLAISLNEQEVYSFDREGRLLTAWMENKTFVRTLDNRVIKKYRDPNRPFPWKLICELQPAEKSEFFHGVRQTIDVLAQAIESNQVELPVAAESEREELEQAKRILARILTWEDACMEREKERFYSVYRPIGILPPDQYFSLVLQATEGCQWNRCTFCHFYDQTRFHIKSLNEFIQHLAQVKTFFGDSLLLRRSIFLGDANALVIPQEILVALLDVINREFNILPGTTKARGKGEPVFNGIYSFLDVFTGFHKSVVDFHQLQQRHLRRVYLGVETGCDDLLQLLNKAASVAHVREVVGKLKAAQLEVGVIIMVGIGGDRHYATHVEKTVALLNSLGLGQGDIIYFSPLWTPEDSEYARITRDQGIRALNVDEIKQQLKELRAGLKFTEGKKPKVAWYDIREFIY
jgi:radical SAM superfamily enzyme YgiQ (UPF0313 family)